MTSTNDEARRLAESGAQGLIAVRAREQTAGRGRRGREWLSPRGNLYLSLLLRPECSIADAAQLSFVVAQALGNAISKLFDETRIQNKWPNDVLLDGKKVAGLLLESSGGDAHSVDWVIIGCGVNIAYHPELPNYPTTSLNSLADREIGTEEVFGLFLNEFEAQHDLWLRSGIVPIRECWLERAVGLGQEIVARLPSQDLHGVFEGLDESGALILKKSDGTRELVSAGEIFAEM